jgi:DNA modification methylase
MHAAEMENTGVRDHGDGGGASRYFPTLDYEDQDFWWFSYTAKPAKREKTAGTIDPDTGESSQTHVTVKPLSVMGWLLDLILPKGERAIDIFAGSGTTLCAAHQRRHLCDGIELLPEHVAIIRDRLNANTIKGWE